MGLHMSNGFRMKQIHWLYGTAVTIGIVIWVGALACCILLTFRTINHFRASAHSLEEGLQHNRPPYLPFS